MKVIKREGKTTSAVINSFMKEFNLNLQDFTFEVVEEGSKGVLGLFGSKKVKIKFTLPDSSERIKSFTQTLMDKMNVRYETVTCEENNGIYEVKISSKEDAGFLIGKEAKLLDSLQYLITQMISKAEKAPIKVKLDVDNYRKRREDALVDKVKSIAEKVKTRNKSITLEPLHAAHRRVVHKQIEKDKDLKTMTIGEGSQKRIVIMPADKLPENSNKKNYEPKRNKAGKNK
jgi:spoIIIJ-associated protein